MKRLNKSTDTYILTNDPSMRAWGWAVLNQDGKVIATGAIKTENNTKALRIRAGDDRVSRMTIINEILISLIKKYDIQYIVSELPHGSQSAAAANMVGSVAAMILTISMCFNIGIEWYSENDAKKAICPGKKVKDKKEMIRLISKKYEVIWQNIKWIDEAVADALAVYYAATKQSSILKFLGK